MANYLTKKGREKKRSYTRTISLVALYNMDVISKDLFAIVAHTGQLALVQVTLSHPEAPVLIAWVNPWMLEMSYA
jgi:hypothetical protein